MSIAKVGEEIFYIGGVEHARDWATKELMRSRLKLHKLYIVEQVNKYGIYKNHYLIDGVYYPPECFEIKMTKNNLRTIYGLK